MGGHKPLAGSSLVRPLTRRKSRETGLGGASYDPAPTGEGDDVLATATPKSELILTKPPGLRLMDWTDRRGRSGRPLDQSRMPVASAG
jgi:hypothetical protein